MHLTRARTLGSLLLTGGVLLTASCGSDHAPAPTAPPSRNIVSSGSKCSDATAKSITDDIKQFFSSTTQQSALNQWKKIISECTTATTGTDNQKAVADIIAYFQFFLVHRAEVQPPAGTTREEASARHFTNALLYGTGEVLGPENAGVTARAFDDSGAVGVCTAGTTCTLTTTWAALQVPPGAIGKPGTTYDQYLFTIAPVDNSECQKENLRFHGPCHDFSVNPATTFLPPYVTVATCIADESLVEESHRYLHAMPTPSATDAATLIKVLPTAAPLGLACANTPPNFLAMAPGSGGAFARAWRGLAGAASRVMDVFAPEPLFAIHTTSSSTSTLPKSPIGVVDPLIFLDTWDSSSTGPLSGSFRSQWGGSWFAFATPPGSITVQSSFLGLSGKQVVLNQAGGNCGKTCGGLQLTATIDSVPSTGVYRVSWLSVEDAATVKSAPFVIRSSPRLSTPADTVGDTIAVVAYTSKSSANRITFTTASGAIVATTWTKDVWQRFVVDVDLNARTVTLTVLSQNGQTVLAQKGPYGFVSSNAKNLRRIAAEFSGIDAGVVGWDDIDVTRLADKLPL
ncbi:MAG TPA: hypothetical protein VFS05_07435 [Gemmatimonadaceae bacterium]|nr:hypothetical protein [Gemmatimonadaceae bacterium]